LRSTEFNLLRHIDLHHTECACESYLEML
jgi:hypothetical protein